MSDKMPSNREREAADDVFRNTEETLRQLRAAATTTPAPPESWLKKTLHPAAPSSHQSEFNLALVDSLARLLSAVRETAASEEARLGQMGEESRGWRALSENLDAFRERYVRLEAELRSIAANVRGLQERSAALETELAQAREEQRREVQRLSSEQSEKIQQLSGEQTEKIQQLSTEQSEKVERLSTEQSEKFRQLSGEQENLRRELDERIQHLLDEQRVCIRQLSLQASEEAVLADRARRAAELKLDELARRVPPPPA